MLKLYYNILYWVYFGPISIRIGRSYYAYLTRKQGRRAADVWVHRYSLRGRPSHFLRQLPEFTYHGARFRAKVRLGPPSPNLIAKRPWLQDRDRPLRLGCLGRFSGSLSYGETFFRGLPQEVETTIFDVAFQGRCLSVLETLPVTYVSETESDLEKISRDIRAANLDVLVCFWAKIPRQVLDRVDVPRIVHIAGGSSLLHHPRIDLQVLGQTTPFMEIRDGRLNCLVTGQSMSHCNVMFNGFVYDPRDIEITPPTKWASKKNFVFSFGSLFKFSPGFLESVFDVLRDNDNIDFVFMGRDRGGDLEMILEAAQRAGFSNRVHYEGEFSSTRSPNGLIEDEGWARCKTLLSEARVCADTWPNTGGSCRFEAYLLGAPLPFLGYPKNVGRGVRSYVDWATPILDLPETEAFTPQQLTELSSRFIREETFANDVIEKQYSVALNAMDTNRWWRDMLRTAAAEN